MDIRLELYEVSETEAPVARCSLDDQGNPICGPDGEPVLTYKCVPLSKNDRHVHTFRFVDAAGEVVFSPTMRFHSKEQAERVANRFLRNLNHEGTFKRQYKDDETRDRISKIEFPKGII